MKILLGSTNTSKKASLEQALLALNITDYEIIPFKANSKVSSKPIGPDIIIGAHNRNQDLKEYAKKNKIDYDYLCSIEGGYELTTINNQEQLPFIVTYCVIEDKYGKESTGKSLGLRLTMPMYKYIEQGNSLNKIIEEIIGTENNKQNGGITGYLSQGILNRSKVDKEAVISSMISFVFKEQRDKLNNNIIKKK